MEAAANEFQPRKPPKLTSAARRAQPDEVKLVETRATNLKPRDNLNLDWKPPGLCSSAVRTDQIKVWDMKRPHPPLLWAPNYPKRHHSRGPGPEIPVGAFRPGPECVGQIAEFNERRVCCSNYLRACCENSLL
jgi:hypothetical protein